MTEHPKPAGDPADQFNPDYLDQLDNAIRGAAVRMAIDMRIEQILRYGHDAEHDAMQPISHCPREALKRLHAAIEQIEATGERRNLPVAIKNLARTAALCMAGIDRLQAAIDSAERVNQRQEAML